MNSLQHFQQHSRLHFIGQWKTKMEDLFQTWFSEHPEWNHGTLSHQSLFIHVDMDAFFCSVQLAKPEHAALRSIPVGIAAGNNNSDISSCNYVARSFGIHAGMYVNRAKELCPSLVILRYDLPACERVTMVLYNVIFETFPTSVNMSMEVYSIDEVVIATDTNDYGLLHDFCERMRDELFRSTSCTASCGIGPNIMLARLATQKAKPNGIFAYKREDVPETMQALPFHSIHGAGSSTISKVCQALCERHLLSPSTKREEDSDHPLRILCGDVQKLSKADLQAALGKKAGETFYSLCRGSDNRVVLRTGDPSDQKALGKTTPNAVGCSMNYAVRPTKLSDVWSIAEQLVQEVCAKLKRGSLSAHGLRVTLLERHPLHPKETKKFMGRGFCIEVHIPVKFLHPLDETGAVVMLDEIKKQLAPLLVASRGISDEERAKQLHLEPNWESHVIWTITLANLRDIVIEDIRGMTVQATVLRVRGEVPIVRKRTRDGQLTLAAAFSRRNAGKGTSTVTVVDSSQESASSKEEPSHALASASSLLELYLLPWGDDFCGRWKQGCAAACRAEDLPSVKAYLRCAMLKLSGAPSQPNARGELEFLVSFVNSKIETAISFY